MFILLSLPSWFTLTTEMVDVDTISVATWERFWKVCFRDMYPLQTHLWQQYRAIYFHPVLPARKIRMVGDLYLLGPKFSKLYVAQVLAVVARVLCHMPLCRVPNDFGLMREHLLGSQNREVGMCGRFWAKFRPVGVSISDLWERGQC